MSDQAFDRASNFLLQCLHICYLGCRDNERRRAVLSGQFELMRDLLAVLKLVTVNSVDYELSVVELVVSKERVQATPLSCRLDEVFVQGSIVADFSY